MKIATYNIQYGFGRDGRYDLARAIRVISDADIIALQEVERGWARTARNDQPRLIEALLPDRFLAYAPFFDRDASERSEQGHVHNRRRQFGVMTISRWPILWARPQILPKQDGHEVFNLETGFLETAIATPRGIVRVVNVHLGHLSEEERLAQVAAIQTRFAAAAQDGGPWNGTDADAHAWEEGEPPPALLGTVMLGDFNTGPGGAAYHALAALRSPEGQAFVNAWTEAHPPDAVGTTYFANPAQGEEKDEHIDHIFLAGDRLRPVCAAIDLMADGSDHQPVFVSLD